MIELMQRRALSPLGLKRQRVGRKAIASARMLHGIEKRLPRPTGSRESIKNRRSRLPQYRFRRWHAFILLGVVVLGIAGNFGYMQYQQAQQKARQKQAEIKQQAEIKASNERQTCYKQVVTEKAAQIGTLTYDQLYGGKCQ